MTRALALLLLLAGCATQELVDDTTGGVPRAGTINVTRGACEDKTAVEAILQSRENGVSESNSTLTEFLSSGRCVLSYGYIRIFLLERVSIISVKNEIWDVWKFYIVTDENKEAFFTWALSSNKGA